MSVTSSTAPRRRDTRLIRLLGVAVSVGAILLLVLTLDVRNAFVVLGSAAPLPLLAVLPVVALQVVVRSSRWRLVLPRVPEGGRARFSSVTSALLIGYLGNAVLPARLGEPIRAAVVGRAERIPIGGAFGAVVLERVVDTAVLAVVGLAAAIAIGAPGWIVNLAVFVAAIGLSLILLLATVGLDPFLAAARWVADRLPGHVRGVARSMLGRLATFVDGVSGHRRRPDVLAAAGLSGIGWLLDATIIALVGFAIGLPIQPGEALVISTVGALATAVPSARGSTEKRYPFPNGRSKFPISPVETPGNAESGFLSPYAGRIKSSIPAGGQPNANAFGGAGVGVRVRIRVGTGVGGRVFVGAAVAVSVFVDAVVAVAVGEGSVATSATFGATDGGWLDSTAWAF